MKYSLCIHFQGKMWLDDLSKVTLFNESFTSNTYLEDTKFDIITISHVFYYMSQPERTAIFKMLQNGLEPNGIFFVVHKLSELDDKIDVLSSMVTELGPKFANSSGEARNYTNSNMLLSGKDLLYEFAPLVNYGLHLEFHPYEVNQSQYITKA